MANENFLETHVYCVYITDDNSVYKSKKVLWCVMPNELTAKELASNLLGIPLGELSVSEYLLGGTVHDKACSQIRKYGYCNQFITTNIAPYTTEIPFRYRWVSYSIPSRKDITDAILKDLIINK